MAAMRLEECALVLHPLDSVAVLKRPLRAGTELAWEAGSITATSDIPAGHKIALRGTEAGAAVLKYGQVIGFATRAIAPGDHVHAHNLEARLFTREGLIGSEVK